MYMLAGWTGFRKGETGSLTRRSLRLAAEPPTATIVSTRMFQPIRDHASPTDRSDVEAITCSIDRPSNNSSISAIAEDHQNPPEYVFVTQVLGVLAAAV